jgi:hypothetical protein
MALMDAKEYDPRPAQRRLRLVLIAIALLLVLLVLWFWPSGRFRFWSQWHVANSFFVALEQKDFEKAYGIYQADPDWKQHPQQYSNYGLSQFTLDWGPSGEFGSITSHRVDCALKPKSNSSGVVVVVTINNRAETHSIWVESKSKSITAPSPVGDVLCHGQQ